MQKEIIISSSKREELIDITSQVEEIVKESKIKEGICVIYTPHATGAIIINENADPNICDDVLEALSKLIPAGRWRHDRIDNNADAHIKSSIIGPHATIPIKNGSLQLGTWQDCFFAELDGPRSGRKIVISIIGG
jgi:secondary thiamine-phosphate synthase enzyme